MGNELDQRNQNITKLLNINHNTHNQNVTMSVKQYMTQYKATIKTPCRTSRLQERSVKQKGRRDIPYYINHMSVLSIYVMLLKVVAGATSLILL